MKKYRIIKAIAKDEEKPYFPQYWDKGWNTWSCFKEYKDSYYGPGIYMDRSYKTLREAKMRIQQERTEEKRLATPAEVVWEEEGKE